MEEFCLSLKQIKSLCFKQRGIFLKLYQNGLSISESQSAFHFMTGWIFGVVWKIILDILPGKYMRYYYQTPKNLIKYNNIFWLWFCETTLITEKYYLIFLWPSMSLEIVVCLLRKFIKEHIKLTETNSSFFRVCMLNYACHS